MSGNRSNRFSTLSDPHNSKSGSGGFDPAKLVQAGSGSGSGQRNAEQARRGGGMEEEAAGFMNPLEMALPPSRSASPSRSSSGSVSKSSSWPSGPRPLTIHPDPFPSFSTPSFNSKGPRDPNQGRGPRVAQPMPMKTEKNKEKPPEGFGFFQPPFFPSKWPGVTWHRAQYKGKNKKKEDYTREAIVRCINSAQASKNFLSWMASERAAMDTLDNRFILRYTAFYRVLNREGEKLQLVVFPKCKQNMVEFMKKGFNNKGMEEKDAIQYVGQVAQALA